MQAIQPRRTCIAPRINLGTPHSPDRRLRVRQHPLHVRINPPHSRMQNHLTLPDVKIQGRARAPALVPRVQNENTLAPNGIARELRPRQTQYHT